MSGLVRGKLDVQVWSWRVEPDICPAHDAGLLGAHTFTTPLCACSGMADGARYCPAYEWAALDLDGQKRRADLEELARVRRQVSGPSLRLTVMCKAHREDDYEIGAQP